ncbi:MAG: cupin domain-containing protein [Deltaproteobacteria bacterium]|nr:cupin domain-containing protein [Deltaproteobacteria bacterium]
MSHKNLVIHETEGKKIPNIRQEAIMMITAETAGSVNLSFAKVTYRPGDGSPLHHHDRTEEIYYILSGYGKVVIDDEEFPVRPGHAVLLPVGSIHRILNTGDQDLVYFCIDSPSYEHADTIVES